MQGVVVWFLVTSGPKHKTEAILKKQIQKGFKNGIHQKSVKNKNKTDQSDISKIRAELVTPKPNLPQNPFSRQSGKNGQNQFYWSSQKLIKSWQQPGTVWIKKKMVGILVKRALWHFNSSWSHPLAPQHSRHRINSRYGFTHQRDLNRTAVVWNHLSLSKCCSYLAKFPQGWGLGEWWGELRGGIGWKHLKVKVLATAAGARNGSWERLRMSYFNTNKTFEKLSHIPMYICSFKLFCPGLAHAQKRPEMLHALTDGWLCTK